MVRDRLDARKRLSFGDQEGSKNFGEKANDKLGFYSSKLDVNILSPGTNAESNYRAIDHPRIGGADSYSTLSLLDLDPHHDWSPIHAVHVPSVTSALAPTISTEDRCYQALSRFDSPSSDLWSRENRRRS